MSVELYKKLFLGRNCNDLEKFEGAFEQAVENFPISGNMPSNNKRMQAAQRIKWLTENQILGQDFAVEALDFIYHVDDEELDRIAF